MTCIYRRNGRRLASLHGNRTMRTLLSAAVAMGSFLPALPSQGAPVGGQIETGPGSGTITQAGNTTTITQLSNLSPLPARMIINWVSFSSAVGEKIVFNQPAPAAKCSFSIRTVWFSARDHRSM